MLNYTRIKWTYEHFGLAMAVRSATYDLLAILAYIGYCLTLPFRFISILYRGLK